MESRQLHTHTHTHTRVHTHTRTHTSTGLYMYVLAKERHARDAYQDNAIIVCFSGAWQCLTGHGIVA